ncbi:MAG TPA: hypothetical protein ENJ39_08175 [Flammeovirgaceae bacterium]|nr:hypothetical protein [Flammeovirgaceae bacterium]
MNNSPAGKLHFLFDETLYVLPEHGDSHPGGGSAYKGQNKKGILIANYDRGAHPIKPLEEEFIFKGLHRLSISLDDVVILNPEDWQAEVIDQQFPYRVKLVFQAEEPAAGQRYQPQQAGDLTTLYCHPIQEIMNSQELKKLFWQGLKALWA